MKVAVAMSGGVDSSVAAALLTREGHDVIGVTMQISRLNESAARKAAGVAGKLGIPHHVIDLTDIFTDKVVSYFCREYGRGLTPNPCVRCNRYVKFGALLESAKGMGAALMATGHYARMEPHEGRCLLKKGLDPHKDQSYFLYALTQEQLSQALFPVGNLTKDEVRQMAQDMDLPVTADSESQEICFIPDDDYPAFLKEHLPGAAKPGPIIDERGNVMGKHDGIMSYTIGQRRGLSIAAREPQYVIAIEPERNTIVIGGREAAYDSELTATDLNWIALSEPTGPIKVKAKIRYRHPEAGATVIPLAEDKVCVRFAEPQMAITPGQAVVFYDGETVIGGGIIAPTGKEI